MDLATSKGELADAVRRLRVQEGRWSPSPSPGGERSRASAATDAVSCEIVDNDHAIQSAPLLDDRGAAQTSAALKVKRKQSARRGPRHSSDGINGHAVSGDEGSHAHVDVAIDDVKRALADANAQIGQLKLEVSSAINAVQGCRDEVNALRGARTHTPDGTTVLPSRFGNSMADEELESASGIKAPQIDNGTSEWEALRNVLLASHTFGLFNIFMTHPPGIVKILPLIVLLIQVVVPLSLFVEEYKNYDGGLCPGTADVSMRLLMGGVASLYFVRSTMTYMTKLLQFCAGCVNLEYYKETLSPDLRKEIDDCRASGVIHSVLNDYGQVDDFMEIVYEGMITLLNLWLVFVADEALDIVLNSIAMEFLAKIDNEFKDQYFKFSARAVSAILKQGLHKKPSVFSRRYNADGKLMLCRQLTLGCICSILQSLNFLALFVIPGASLVMTIYGPICKP